MLRFNHLHILSPVKHIEYWISKGIYPLVTEGFLIAKFLGVSIEYLLTGKEENTGKKISAIRSLLKQADERLKRL